ncbi:MAG: PIN domain-containing protein [Verrucomicrobiota bacterium]
MIHLDANILIRLSVPGSGAAKKVRKWLLAGETLSASAPAWFEYISGPVTAQDILHAEAILTGGVANFEKEHSHKAADLFNLTDRRRAMKLDCMIAASALLHRAKVATTNVTDFLPFVPHGLAIEAVPI